MCKITARFRYDTPAGQAVAAGGHVAFSNSVSDSDYVVDAENDGIRILKPGTYMVLVNAVVVGTAEQTVTLQLYEGSDPVPGARGSASVADAGDSATIAFNAASSVFTTGPDRYATFYLVSPSGGTFTAANVILVKVG